MSLFALQLRGELHKLFARKRTYLGFGAFLLLEILILALLQLPKVKGAFRKLIESNGYAFEHYFSGLTLAFLILMWTIFFLGALYLALVGGDIVSKEVEDGTMRMMLCRPVSRFRILLVKFIACMLYTAALIGFIGVTALLAGFVQGGIGGIFVFAPLENVFALYEFGPGLFRYALAVSLLSVSLATVTAMGFFFSCFNMKPAAATIITLSIFFVDTILRNVPYFESIKGFFLTAHMAAWIHVFDLHPSWTVLIADYAFLIAINATFFVMGWLAVEARDFKS